MALTTKSFVEWAGKIRSIFQAEDMPADITRTPARQSSQDAVLEPIIKSEPGTEQQQNYPFSDRESEFSSENESQGQVADDEMIEMSLEEKMEMAKDRYPGAKEWAEDEEKLFKILFLRQDLPMLPSNWMVDFRGFPLPERIFDTSDENPPIIYAHKKNSTTEYTATATMTRLIDLTLAVRTLIESDIPTTPRQQRRKRKRGAAIIKNRLDEMLAWAARDGGYDGLNYVPNVVAEVVEAADVQSDIVNWMNGRMAALVRLQKEYLREGRGDDFWTKTYPTLMGLKQKRVKQETPVEKVVRAGMKRGTETRPQTPDLCRDEVQTVSPDTMATPRASDYGPEQRQLFKKLKIGTEGSGTSISTASSNPIIKVESLDDTTPRATKVRRVLGAATPQSHRTTAPLEKKSPASDVKYRHKPPVVYGLFILNTSVLILTADSSRDSSAYISFHLDISFADSHQSVWNALTVAAVVCAARDELMTRADDFEPKPKVYESDPDA